MCVRVAGLLRSLRVFCFRLYLIEESASAFFPSFTLCDTPHKLNLSDKLVYLELVVNMCGASSCSTSREVSAGISNDEDEHGPKGFR